MPVNPSVTVLMAVHNGAHYLRTAVESILDQTYSHFRFLIVDDASTDETRSIVNSYRHPSVELLALERNVGQTAALNIGLRRVSTPWIARMDADDFSAPERLEEQVRVLEQNPSVRCFGTQAWEFRDDPRKMEVVVARPERPDQIWRAALQGCGIIHGSVLISRDALLEIGGYNERYRYASDRDLFIRFLKRYPAINIPKPLLGARRHPSQDSFSLAAATEYVDLFSRLLAREGFEPAERAVLQQSLTYSHLFRSDCYRKKGNPWEGWKDTGRAFRVSPAFFLRTGAGSLVKRFAPGSLRERWMDKQPGIRRDER